MNEIQFLFDKICLLNQTYKKLEDEKGENYNLFKVINMTSNETSVHSAFLADLLNPKGMHHMGDVFLKLFTDEFLNKMSFSTKDAIVEQEKYIGPVTTTTGGRLDILITDVNKKAIIIENKIYASDQKNQLIRYYNYAEEMTSKYELFYLSLDGIVHDEYKTAKCGDKELKEGVNYFTLSYENDILKWLELCRQKVANKPLIRESISHYINLIKFLTNQTLSKDMEKELTNLILENPIYIKNLEIIRQAITMSVIELQKRFWELLKDKMEGSYPVIEDNTYKYALDKKKNRIKGFYGGMPNNRRYGFEFLVNDCGKYEIRYAIRIDEPMVCGFFIRKKQYDSNDVNHGRRISTREDFGDLIEKIENIKDLGYKHDDGGNWYLGVKDLTPDLRFKTLDPETLFNLSKMDETVSKIAESITNDISTIKQMTQNLSY